MRRGFAFVILLASAGFFGCADKAPPVHPIAGKVTYGGKPYPRLLVYFRPASGEVDKFGSNLGVGETDAEGKLSVKSAAGAGLQTGDYKVTFSLFLESRSGKPVGGSEKPDESGVAAKQVIAPPHDDESSQASTPVSFTVKSGSNTFDFDIPKAK